MFNWLKNIFKKKHKWICEYCGDVVKSHKQPFCKPCCHVHRTNVKMIYIKTNCCGKCK